MNKILILILLLATSSILLAQTTDIPAISPDAVSVSTAEATETPSNPEPALEPKPSAEPVVSDALTVAEQPESESSSGVTFWILVKAGGWIGVIIFILSLAACTLTIQLFLKIRRSVLLPNELIDEFGAFVEKGRLQSALESCHRHPSLLASVLTAGLKNFEAGWDDVEKGAGESLTQETARLYRRNDFLAVIGNISPMLGLLGTVLGMVTAFGELAASDGLGRFANLAQGIYFALVTTVDGLLVAIPALALYSFFNHRVASISSEAAELATELFRPLKRHFLSRAGSPAVPPAQPLYPTSRSPKEPLA